MNQQKIVQTLAVMAAGFAATKVLDLVWRKATGHRPPTVGNDDDSTLREIVVFAAVSGALAALARAGAGRAAARWSGQKLNRLTD